MESPSKAATMNSLTIYLPSLPPDDTQEVFFILLTGHKCRGYRDAYGVWIDYSSPDREGNLQYYAENEIAFWYLFSNEVESVFDRLF